MNTYLHLVELRRICKPKWREMIPTSLTENEYKYLFNSEFWNCLSLNPSDKVVRFLQKFKHLIAWEFFRTNRNPLAIDIVRQNGGNPIKSKRYGRNLEELDNYCKSLGNFHYRKWANINIILKDHRLHVLHIWTHHKQNVLYRMPLELVRMICDFV